MTEEAVVTAEDRDEGVDQLRISIVLSGGASLGAYQAGVVAAVLSGVRRLQRDAPGSVVVDGMGGASAGAIVALLGSHALLEGLDPADFLHEAWVERVSFDLLRRAPGDGLLSVDRLRAGICKFVEEAESGSGEGQRSPVGFHVALTGLQGLTYPLSSLHSSVSYPAATYADWFRVVLEPGGGPEQILHPEGTAPLDFALASAAHPGAFKPVLLDRRSDREVYERLGIDNFPKSGHMYYTDGGICQSEPLSRVLAAAREADKRIDGELGYRRALLLVDPRSEDPSGASDWTDPSQSPKWLRGLSRSLEIMSTQVIYDDALRVEKTNARVQWKRSLIEVLEPHLDAEARESLQTYLQRVERDRSSSPKAYEQLEVPDTRPEATANLLERAIDSVTGLAGKEVVDVNIITPLLVGEETSEAEVPRLLAGEFMGDFGGFLERDVRRSDFLLGYASAEAWLESGLRDTGLDEEALARMTKEVSDRSPGDWREANKGDVKPSQLSWSARRGLARLSWDLVRAIAADAVVTSSLSGRLDRMRHKGQRSLSMARKTRGGAGG